MDDEFDEVHQGQGFLLVKEAGSHIPENALRLWVQIPRSEVSPMAPDYSTPNLTWTALRIESRFAPSHVGGVVTYEEENEEAVSATPMFYWDEDLL